jgi:hypothetical protein
MDLKSNEAFCEGIPKVVDLIANVPEAKRTLALAAAYI